MWSSYYEHEEHIWFKMTWKKIEKVNERIQKYLFWAWKTCFKIPLNRSVSPKAEYPKIGQIVFSRCTWELIRNSRDRKAPASCFPLLFRDRTGSNKVYWSSVRQITTWAEGNTRKITYCFKPGILLYNSSIFYSIPKIENIIALINHC